MAVSELQRRSSELHVHLSSSTSTAAQADTNVGGLPTPPSAQQLVKEVLPPFRRKRAASGDGASSTKKTRTLSASSMGTTVAAMSSEDFDSDDSVFENRPLARCAKKSKPRQVLSSSEDHPPHRHHQQGQPLPTEAASTSHSAQETEENDTTYSRESLTNYFPVPGMCLKGISIADYTAHAHMNGGGPYTLIPPTGLTVTYCTMTQVPHLYQLCAEWSPVITYSTYVKYIGYDVYIYNVMTL